MIVEDAIELKKEFSIKVVDTVDIKDEIPEAVTFTPVKTEQEVRLWCVCVGLWQLVLSGHVLPERTSCTLCSNTSIV